MPDREETVKSGTSYYYPVCAVDTAGLHGNLSNPAHFTTKPTNKEEK